MENAIITGMAKLMKEKVEITVPRYQYQILDLKKEIESLSKSARVRTSKKVLAFWRKQENEVISKKLDFLRARLIEMEAEVINGYLTPLTELEMWDCRCVYARTRIFLKNSQAVEELTPEARRASDEAIDLISNGALIAKQIECVLKKKEKVAGQWVRYFTADEASKMDPRTLNELWLRYISEFELSSEEIKKSYAPMMNN